MTELNNAFASDNYGDALDEILDNQQNNNKNYHNTYGTDDYTLSVMKQISRVVNHTDDAKVMICTTGTGANIVAASVITDRIHSLLGDSWSHYNTDESGALERMIGIKFIPIDTLDGKLIADDVKSYIYRQGDIHRPQVGAVTISNVNEVGGIYSPQDIHELAEVCHDNGFYLHVDGARIFYAAQKLQCSIYDLIGANNVDIFTFGFTKIGAINADVVVVLNPDLKHNASYHQKGLGQLASKQWYQALQIEIMLKDNCELPLLKAQIANEAAARIYNNLKNKYSFVYRHDANSLFVVTTINEFYRLKSKYNFYVWERYDDNHVVIRIMCNGLLQKQDVNDLINEFQDIRK